MKTDRITTATVNGNQYVKYYRKIHEVATKDGMNLIMSEKSPVNQKSKGYVMLVHGLGQNRYTWTLTKRSLENYLTENGFTTFNIELRGHGLSRANGSNHPETFETYLDYDMPAFVDAIFKITGGGNILLYGPQPGRIHLLLHRIHIPG